MSVLVVAAIAAHQTCQSRCWNLGNRFVPTAAPAVYTDVCAIVETTNIYNAPTTTFAGSPYTNYYNGYQYSNQSIQYIARRQAEEAAMATTQATAGTTALGSNPATWSPTAYTNAGTTALGSNPATWTPTNLTFEDVNLSEEECNNAVNRVWYNNACAYTSGATTTLGTNTNWGTTSTIGATGIVGGTTYYQPQQYYQPQYYQPPVNTWCDDEMKAVEAQKAADSEAALEAWEEIDSAQRAQIQANEESGFCNCDALCMVLGDCCEDFEWWCTSGDFTGFSMATTTFPMFGSVHEPIVTAAPATAAPVTAAPVVNVPQYYYPSYQYNQPVYNQPIYNQPVTTTLDEEACNAAADRVWIENTNGQYVCAYTQGSTNWGTTTGTTIVGGYRGSATSSTIGASSASFSCETASAADLLLLSKAGITDCDYLSAL